MRRALFIFYTVLLTFAGSGGDGGAQTTHVAPGATRAQAHMKGYELYAWRVRGRWYFSLLVGTNRVKTRAEATSRASRLDGVESLKRSLRRLPAGAEVFWLTRRVPRMSVPPRELVEELRGYCRRHGVVLHVVEN